MTDVATFARFCGPGALAAVTGCTREWAAAKLRSISARDDWRIDAVYTDSPALVSAIREAGYELEDWSVESGGWRKGLVSFATRDEIEQILIAVAAVNEQHAPVAPTFTTDARGQWTRREFDRLMRASGARQAERKHRRCVRALTVAQWLARFPIAPWVLSVHQHVLVARAGVLVAGDDFGRWNQTPLRAAWRVVRQ